MKLVYVDKSAKDQEIYLFGGLVLDENQCVEISKRLDSLTEKVVQDNEEKWLAAGKARSRPRLLARCG